MGEDGNIVDQLKGYLTVRSELFARQKREYSQFLMASANLPPLDKATAWLSYMAEHRESESDLEALVFLASRGLDISRQVAQVKREWKRADGEALAQHNSDPKAKRVGSIFSSKNEPEGGSEAIRR